MGPGGKIVGPRPVVSPENMSRKCPANFRKIGFWVLAEKIRMTDNISRVALEPVAPQRFQDFLVYVVTQNNTL